jgi:sulfite reductase alpha subunit-like flavoprotein
MGDTQLGQKHDRTALVLYGSETGNSQDVAEDLGRLAQRLHFVTRVCEMDQVQLVCLLCPSQRNCNKPQCLFFME